MIGLLPMQCVALRGNGLPHQSADWFAMTAFLLYSALISVQPANKFCCHCEAAGCGSPGVLPRASRSGRNPFPGIRRENCLANWNAEKDLKQKV